MRLDFSDLPLKETAFSDKPMTFIDQGPKNFLGAVMDLVAIETGNRSHVSTGKDANRQFLAMRPESLHSGGNVLAPTRPRILSDFPS